MNPLLVLKVFLSIRAWRRSRTLKVAAAGAAGGAAMALDPSLVHLATAAFNFVSPVDLTDASMTGVILFGVSLGAALLRADTHDSLTVPKE